jgi:hypothetical protein
MSHGRPISGRRRAIAASLFCALALLGLIPWKLFAQAPDTRPDEALRDRWKLLSEADVDAVVFRNLQGIVRAAHAYYDTRGVLPPAAVPNPDLPPNKRLSGLVLLLPYFDRATELWQGKEKEPLYDEATRKLARELYQSIDLKKAWDDPVNLPATRTLLPALLVPNSVAPLRDEAGNALSHFAFVRGHAGEDDGAFTDDTTVTILGGQNNIDDGTVSTLALAQVTASLGPWAAAGHGTSRWIYHASDPVSKAAFGTLDEQAIYAVNCDSLAYVLDLKNSSPAGLAALAAKSDGSVVDPGSVATFRTKAAWRNREKKGSR